MADDIKVVADFTDLQLLRRELVGVSKDAQKSAAVFEREFNKVERQLKANATASQKWYSETLKLSKATKDASQSASVFERELAKQEARVESLAMKYKPLYASSKQYERALEEINEAHRLNVLNTQQHEAAVENLNKEYTAFINGKAGWENQFVTGSSRAGKSLNRFGMYAQQVGYQVGDFFVQIQSGTNFFVAFGQQATQLAGLLPGVAGAVVGIGISVTTMLLGAYTRVSDQSKQAAKEALEGIEELKARLIEVRDLQDRTQQQQNQRMAALQQEANQFLRLIEAAEKQASRMSIHADDLAVMIRPYQDALKDIYAQQDALREEMEEYKKLLDDIAKAEAIKSLKEEIGEAAVKALELANIDIAGPISSAAKEAAVLAANMGVALSAAVSIKNLQSSKQYSGRGGDPRKVGSDDYTSQLGYKTVDELIKEMTGSGGSKADDQRQSRLDQLMNSLMTEQEQVQEWRSNQLELLKEFNDTELALIGGHTEAKFRIEKEYEDRVRALKVNKTQQTTSAISGILTGFAGLMDANNKKQFERQKKFQVAAAVVDGYSAAVSAWDKGMKMGGPFLAAAFTAGSLLKTGALIKSINSAQFGGGASQSVGGGGAAATIPATSEGTGMRPQRVIIEGINRDTLITGEQLSNIFDQLYKENEDRGFVFEVAQ